MHWFYCTDIHQQTAVLDEVESRHCIKSLRHQVGDELLLTDGKGNLYTAVIENANAKRCELSITSVHSVDPLPYQLHIAIAPTKQNERLEWFLEKATEIGISEITPIVCSNSERRKIKTERLEKVLITAMKQSHHTILPKLNDLRSLQDLLNTAGDHLNKYIAHCRDEDLPLLKDCIRSGSDTLVLIGPEGDFTKEEIELAANKGFQPISLGRSRLRTETAGIVAAQTLAFVNS